MICENSPQNLCTKKHQQCHDLIDVFVNLLLMFPIQSNLSDVTLFLPISQLLQIYIYIYKSNMMVWMFFILDVSYVNYIYCSDFILFFLFFNIYNNNKLSCLTLMNVLFSLLLNFVQYHVWNNYIYFPIYFYEVIILFSIFL